MAQKKPTKQELERFSAILAQRLMRKWIKDGIPPRYQLYKIRQLLRNT